MKRTLTVIIVFLFSLSGIFARVPSQLQKPFSRVELLALLEAGQSHLELAVARRGIDFQPTEDYLQGLKVAGARDTLIEALRKAPAPAVPAAGITLSPGSSAGRASADPEAMARESQVLQHLFQAAKLKHDRAWAEAEQEFRLALAIDPNNPLLHVDLATVLPSSQGEPGWHAVDAEVREALRLEPDLAVAHLRLATQLQHYYDRQGAIAEYREVVRLDPDDAYASNQLGRLLEAEGDQEGAMAAYKEAVRRKPDEASFYTELADLLEKKGDLDGAIAQAREAIRIAPDSPGGHFVLARMLRIKGDDEEAARESLIANTLQAKNPIKRIRVGGTVMSAKLVHQVRPSYPDEAKRAGIQGTVRLRVMIGKDGKVRNITLLSGNPVLVKAAMKAVSKWRYQPSLLDGKPVEVLTEIDVNFVLGRN
jgi:TonB family protein